MNRTKNKSPLNYFMMAILTIGALLLIYWAGLLVRQFFTPQSTFLTIDLTEFDKMAIKNNTDCRHEYNYPYSVQMRESILNYISTNYNISSKKPISLSLTLPPGKITAIAYLSGKSQGNSTDFFKSEQDYFGTVDKIEVDMIQMSQIDIQEEICSPQITFYPATTFPFWMGYSYGINDVNGIKTRQWMLDGDKIKITFSGKLNFENYDFSEVDKVEISIEVSSGSPLILQAVSPGLTAELPSTVKGMLRVKDPSVSPLKAVAISADEIEIKYPKGVFNIKNETPFDFRTSSNSENEKIVIPHLFDVIGDIDNGNYTVTTTTTSVTLRGEELIKNSWQKMSSEAQVAIFGLLLTFVGGMWGAWRFYDSRKVKRFQYKTGNFVCVTKTGMTITGELLRKPGRNFPYYIIKNARKKPSPSGYWEEDVITEIKIHADSVEQSYVA